MAEQQKLAATRLSSGLSALEAGAIPPSTSARGYGLAHDDDDCVNVGASVSASLASTAWLSDVSAHDEDDEINMCASVDPSAALAARAEGPAPVVPAATSWAPARSSAPPEEEKSESSLVVPKGGLSRILRTLQAQRSNERESTWQNRLGAAAATAAGGGGAAAAGSDSDEFIEVDEEFDSDEELSVHAEDVVQELSLHAEAGAGLGRALALHHRPSTCTGLANIFGAFVSEAAVRPNPRRTMCSSCGSH